MADERTCATRIASVMGGAIGGPGTAVPEGKLLFEPVSARRIDVLYGGPDVAFGYEVRTEDGETRTLATGCRRGAGPRLEDCTNALEVRRLARLDSDDAVHPFPSDVRAG